MPSLVAEETRDYVAMPARGHAALVESTDDPCRYWGCNAHTCAWETGEVVRKVASGRSCRNAKPVAPSSTSRIETLADCLHALKANSNLQKAPVKSMRRMSQSSALRAPDEAQCSPYFEMHMDTFQCSCVPSGSDCDEKVSDKICRYELVRF
eukprot:CAMPEP_0169140256 /NCGR_PEP_ID=MMETSP1015-20121227/43496_1 /TAXON_ID=342587 /ORGANISM="Karlodinium micrum, Strain CCMP2283" /LENGTH=151 /DNA_ID=CAMNT_0009206197 /DNA_START=225 /DNA_END=680 /DNA_ORIENTATION=+